MILCGSFMRWRVAIQVFKEICKCMLDPVISSVSLSPNVLSKTDFELRLSIALDEKCLEDMGALVSKNGLRMEESNGFLLIY